MIVRVNKTENYTTMSNHHLKNKNLSLKAKGLLSVVLSLPETWEYSVAGLASISKEKESAINSALKELKENGYLKVTKKLPKETKSGRIEYEWDFYEQPQTEKQEVKKQGIENQGLEFQGLEFQGLENQAQLNTNIETTNRLNTNEENTNENIKPPISPEEEMFKMFWEAYPKCFRKANEKGCRAKFVKIKNLKEIFPDIISSLEMQKRSKQWNEKDGEYIPAPLTWINQERWTVTDTRTQRQQIIQEITKKNSDDFLI